MWWLDGCNILCLLIGQQHFSFTEVRAVSGGAMKISYRVLSKVSAMLLAASSIYKYTNLYELSAWVF